MIIGLAKEHHHHEARVPLTPTGVQVLTSHGHEVYVEKDAGLQSGFLNDQYIAAGAKIVYSKEEIFRRSDILLKISPLTVPDLEFIRDGQMIGSAMHLSIAPKELVKGLLDKNVTTFGYELLQDQDGNFPILNAMSEIAGALSIQIGAQYLQNNYGGRGILLDGVAGVPRAIVVILGAGVVGQHAALKAMHAAQVIVLDNDVEKLRKLEALTQHRVTTSYANPVTIGKSVQFANILIGAVLRRGQRAPLVLTEEMIKSMKPKSVFVDVAIDQGGCSETSRPTSWEEPTYVKHDVIHFCVPNIPSVVARTATHALNNALLPFVVALADCGLGDVIAQVPYFANCVFTYQGYATNESMAKAINVSYQPLTDVLR
ncbi:MAG: alanine dehydrogenase [Gemmatimonadetes bacterium]|nr:MAG: alanine dehydrogenase [Gemmatimonadota bacterium]